MDTTDSGTPITSSDWDDVALGVDQSSLDGNLDFLGDLNTDTDVSLSVTASHNSLESGSLTGLGLLLDGNDGHDLIREGVLLVGEELVDDLVLLDWDGESVNFFEGLDLSSLDESSELGAWSPFVLVESSTATWTSSSSSAASATTSSEASSASSFASAFATSSASWATFSWCSCWSLSFH